MSNCLLVAVCFWHDIKQGAFSLKFNLNHIANSMKTGAMKLLVMPKSSKASKDLAPFDSSINRLMPSFGFSDQL